VERLNVPGRKNSKGEPESPFCSMLERTIMHYARTNDQISKAALDPSMESNDPFDCMK
jgi:hypothetical protein